MKKASNWSVEFFSFLSIIEKKKFLKSIIEINTGTSHQRNNFVIDTQSERSTVGSNVTLQ